LGDGKLATKEGRHRRGKKKRKNLLFLKKKEHSFRKEKTNNREPQFRLIVWFVLERRNATPPPHKPPTGKKAAYKSRTKLRAIKRKGRQACVNIEKKAGGKEEATDHLKKRYSQNGRSHDGSMRQRKRGSSTGKREKRGPIPRSFVNKAAVYLIGTRPIGKKFQPTTSGAPLQTSEAGGRNLGRNFPP